MGVFSPTFIRPPQFANENAEEDLSNKMTESWLDKAQNIRR